MSRTIGEKMKFPVLMLLFLFSILQGEDRIWIELPLTSAQGHLWYSTSELEEPKDFNEIGKYSAVKIFDNNPATCWAEGIKGPGIGEKIYFDIPLELTALRISNGLAKNEVIFNKNNRLKKIKINIYGGVTTDEDAGQFADIYRCLPFSKEYTITLEDSFKPQEIKIPLDWALLEKFKKDVLKNFELLDYAKINKSQRYFKFIMSLEILDVYKGSKWDDTCISDVNFIVNNKDGSPEITKIYSNDDENTIFFDTSENIKNILVKDKQSVFQIIENSADKKWLIVIRMPADTGDSRSETEYQLYYVPLKKRVNLKEMGYNAGDLYDFTQEGEHTYLNCMDNKTLDDMKIDLNKVLIELNQ